MEIVIHFAPDMTALLLISLIYRCYPILSTLQSSLYTLQIFHMNLFGHLTLFAGTNLVTIHGKDRCYLHSATAKKCLISHIHLCAVDSALLFRATIPAVAAIGAVEPHFEQFAILRQQFLELRIEVFHVEGSAVESLVAIPRRKV